MNLTKALTQTLTGIIPLIGLLGCSNPADSVPPASVNKSSDPSANAKKSPGAEARYFVFGPEASTIGFVGSKVTGKHEGGFQKFAGEFKVAEGRLADAENKVVIDTSSLFSDNNRLTGHLKSPDFFNVP